MSSNTVKVVKVFKSLALFFFILASIRSNFNQHWAGSCWPHWNIKRGQHIGVSGEDRLIQGTTFTLSQPNSTSTRVGSDRVIGWSNQARNYKDDLLIVSVFGGMSLNT